MGVGSIVHRLVETRAADEACDDVLYQVSSLFRKGDFELDQYLKVSSCSYCVDWLTNFVNRLLESSPGNNSCRLVYTN